MSGGHYETVTAGEVLLKGGTYFSPAVGDVGEVMEGFRQAVAAANASDPFLAANPARLEFLHHDDSTRQSPQIPSPAISARSSSAAAARASPAPAPSAATCATW